MKDLLPAVRSAIQDSIRARLWPLPSLGLLLALTAGLLIPSLDRRFDSALPSWISKWLFNGGASAANTLLDAIASSLITVTSLTFSLTVVTLQLASGQFSPRLLRTFTSDLFVQGTLTLFLGTFVFSLTALRSVRSTTDVGTDYVLVPRMAVTTAFLLVVASAFVLVLFLAHLTKQIRVETMLADVHEDADETRLAVLGDPSGPGARDEPRRPVPQPGPAVEVTVVRSPASGFVTSIARTALLHGAAEAGIVVRVDAEVGGFVVAGVPCAVYWPGEGHRLDDGDHDAARHAVQKGLRIGPERTAGQDLGFGLRQLTDVANKALSPGINDPTTAVHALGHISALLCDLGDHDLAPEVLLDDDDVPRVILTRPDFATLVEDGVGQIRRYGAADPTVIAKLLQVLGDLACRVPVHHQQAVRDQIARAERMIAAQDYDPDERTALDVLAERARADLLRPRP